jgi:hypothetical protein
MSLRLLVAAPQAETLGRWSRPVVAGGKQRNDIAANEAATLHSTPLRRSDLGRHIPRLNERLAIQCLRRNRS